MKGKLHALGPFYGRLLDANLLFNLGIKLFVSLHQNNGKMLDIFCE